MLLLTQSSLYFPEPYMYVETSSYSTSESKASELFQKTQYDWLRGEIDWNSTAGKDAWESAVKLFRNNRHDKQALLSISAVLKEPEHPYFTSSTRTYQFAPSDPWLCAAGSICVDGIRGDEPRTFEDSHHILYPYNVNREMQRAMPKNLSPHQARAMKLFLFYTIFYSRDRILAFGFKSFNVTWSRFIFLLDEC